MNKKLKHSVKRQNNLLLLVVILILEFAAFAQPLTEAQTEVPKFTREYDAVIVTGDKMPPLNNAIIRNIRVYAVHDAELKPIPFQIDEKNKAGKFSLTHGDLTTSDENPRFDKNDELLFMAVDCGKKAKGYSPPKNVVGNIEIEAIDPVNGSKCYAYVFYFKNNPTPLHKTDYVKYNPANDCVFAHYYKVCNNPRHILFENQGIGERAGGNPKVDYVDRLKIRNSFKVKLLGITGGINEDDFISQPVGFKDGNIRVIVRSKVYYKLFGSLKIETEISESFHYMGFYSVPKTFDIPVDLDSVFSTLTFDLYGDFMSSMKGNYFATDLMEKPTLIDGKMDKVEKLVNYGKLGKWNACFGPNGNLVEYTQVDPSIPLKGYQIFFDDAGFNDPPEESLGSFGGFGRGYEMSKLKKGIYWFKSNIFYPKKGFTLDMVNDYINILDKPIEIKTRPFSFERTAKNEVKN